MARIIIGIIIIIIGLSALFGAALLKFVFALILIAVGLWLLLDRKHRWDGNQSKEAISSDDFINEVAIFSPINKIVRSENFKGGKAVMVFGGGQIDISQVKTAQKDINMEIVAVFGGGKLIVPKNWRVNSQGVAIFGGYTNKAAAGAGETVLNIKGAAIFGGVEIIN